MLRAHSSDANFFGKNWICSSIFKKKIFTLFLDDIEGAGPMPPPALLGLMNTTFSGSKSAPSIPHSSCDTSRIVFFLKIRFPLWSSLPGIWLPILRHHLNRGLGSCLSCLLRPFLQKTENMRHWAADNYLCWKHVMV